MRFSCEKAILQAAVNTASRAVSAKSSIPALEGLLLQADTALTISGYNMQTGIRTKVAADVTEEGELVVNARLFGDIIRRMGDDVITFATDAKGATVRLTCGDAAFDIAAISSADYPELPEVEDEFSFTIQQRVLRQMIGETLFAVSANEARPVHTGSLFEIGDGLTIVSVDGFRLALRHEKVQRVDGGPFRFVAPGGALGEVEKICADTEDTAEVTLGNRHLLFEIGDTQLICRRLEGEFLDYKNAIPRKNPIALTVDSKRMIESIDRVSVVISEKLKSPVKCLFDYNKVTMTAKTANGESRDVCPVEGDGDGLEIGFNFRYLAEALRYAPADTVKMELNTGISPAIIVPTEGEENFLYMVLPVRLKNSQGV